MSESARYVTIISESDREDEVLRFTVNGTPFFIKSNIPHWLREEEIEEVERANWTVVNANEDE